MLNLEMVKRELGSGEFWGLSIDERDLLLRCAVWDRSIGVPDAEINSKCGSLVWRLMESLRNLGVEATGLYDLGVLVWGFYDRGLYSDEWLSGVYGAFNSHGGLEGVLAKLRTLGISEVILSELRGVPLDSIAISGVSVEMIANLARMDEEGWYNELAILLSDAKLAGDKGFGVRKDILLMVGKKKGFISQEFGEGAVAAFIAGLTAKAVGLVEQIDNKLVEVLPDE